MIIGAFGFIAIVVAVCVYMGVTGAKIADDIERHPRGK